MAFFAGPLKTGSGTGTMTPAAPAPAALPKPKTFSAGPLPSAGSPAAPSAPSSPDLATNLGAGLWQSIFGTANGLATIGEKGLNTVPNVVDWINKKFGGSGQVPAVDWIRTNPDTFGPNVTMKRVSTPQNSQQAVGKTAGDIAQFFIPGSGEEAAAAKVGDLAKGINLTEHLGPTAGPIVEKAIQTLAGGVAPAASMGTVTAAQTGGDIKQTLASAATGGAFGAGAKALETVAPGFVKGLMKADFKLSPAAEAKAAAKADSAAAFMTDNKILGSATSKYNQLSNLSKSFEDTIQSSIPENAGVPIADVEASLRARVGALKASDPAIYKAAKADADEAISLLRDSADENGTITMKNALNAKRSYGAQAFRTSKYATKDPRVSAEGAYAVEQAFESSIEKNMDRISGSIDVPAPLRSYFGGQAKVSLPEFNKVYSNVISSKNLTFMSQFKSDSGLLGRLFGLWAGSALGETVAPGLPGKIIGGTVGELASTHLPGIMRSIGERIGSASPSTVMLAPRVYQGAKNAMGTGNPFIQAATLMGYSPSDQ